MSIVDDFSQNFRQYNSAKWFKMNDKQGKHFDYSIAWDKDKVFNQPVVNLLGQVEKLQIETTWQFDFRAQDEVELDDGSRWIIDKVGDNETEINEQVVDLFFESTDTIIKLDLTKLCKGL